jgi:hypothetical protein
MNIGTCKTLARFALMLPARTAGAWWHLHSPETRAVVTGGEPKIGWLKEVMVECDVAVGPYARDQWRDSAEAAKRRGVNVAVFNIARVSVRESDLER